MSKQIIFLNIWQRAGTDLEFVIIHCVGINYKFLIGSVGEKANPQHKIISASVEYSFQDVKIR